MSCGSRASKPGAGSIHDDTTPGPSTDTRYRRSPVLVNMTFISVPQKSCRETFLANSYTKILYHVVISPENLCFLSLPPKNLGSLHLSQHFVGSLFNKNNFGPRVQLKLILECKGVYLL